MPKLWKSKVPGPIWAVRALFVYRGRYVGSEHNTTPRPSNVTGGLQLILNFYQIVYL